MWKMYPKRCHCTRFGKSGSLFSILCKRLLLRTKAIVVMISANVFTKDVIDRFKYYKALGDKTFA
jgi:hypothetical protein